MEKGSLMAIEIFVFLGLVGWLVYYQFSTSGRGTGSKEPESDEKTPASSEDQGADKS
ncbi:hypothetical protein [Thiobaca trueperi]|uniref:Uncharacterized protein n=1 Tax=Thiobaca trueperi TaxID=127458 RepID=A0A4R3N2E0_9GAMM|nr:hypothetical protein [Thiobaca trueperi]TCT22301.1 hypothetical protein EDC35_103400 [Thiobaca trueperi]